MRLFCFILPMAGTDFFLLVVSKKDKGFRNGAFYTNTFIFQSQLATPSLPSLSPALTEVARLRKSANSDPLPVHGITKPGFACWQRTNAFGNGQEITEFWPGASKQPLRERRNNFPSLCCNIHGVAVRTVRSIHHLQAERHTCR